jgi:hypothetical protein
MALGLRAEPTTVRCILGISEMIGKNPGVVNQSTIRLSTSRLVGSSQCTSSKIVRTGLEVDSASSCGYCFERFLSTLLRRGREPHNVQGIAAKAFQRSEPRSGAV